MSDKREVDEGFLEANVGGSILDEMLHHVGYDHDAVRWYGEAFRPDFLGIEVPDVVTAVCRDGRVFRAEGLCGMAEDDDAYPEWVQVSAS